MCGILINVISENINKVIGEKFLLKKVDIIGFYEEDLCLFGFLI